MNLSFEENSFAISKGKFQLLYSMLMSLGQRVKFWYETISFLSPHGWNIQNFQLPLFCLFFSRYPYSVLAFWNYGFDEVHVQLIAPHTRST